MQVLDHGFVELVSRTSNPGLAVVNAARCSYGVSKESLDDADRRLIAFLLGNGHTSPFRHAIFTFHVKAPLFVFRQWWKYQVGSTWCEFETKLEGEPIASRVKYGTDVSQVDIIIDTDGGSSWNELSGRYKVLEPVFYVPAVIRSNDGKQSGNGELDAPTQLHAREKLHESNIRAMETYEHLLRCGVAKELARLVLPPSIYSECYWTVSLQAVLHFLEQRLESSAQFEIRAYAQGVLDLIRPSLADMGIKP